MDVLRDCSKDYCAAEEGNNLQAPAVGRKPSAVLVCVVLSQVPKCEGPGAPGTCGWGGSASQQVSESHAGDCGHAWAP